MGWQCALLEHKVMTEVVDKYGWNGLNAENINALLNKTKDFKPLGGIARITYTEKRRTPTSALMYRIEGGKFKPISGWLEVPDMRPAKYR